MGASENDVNGKADLKAKRQRSPSFPVVAIDDAITRLRLIYHKDKRAFTTTDAILTHMGFKHTGGRSGKAGRMISALKQYGLLDEKSGQFRVSDVGFRILHLPDDSAERRKLVAEAALSPPLFQKILAYYEGDLPSDEALRSHLVLNEDFNPDSVELFIRVFRRTVGIANPSPDDYTVGEESEGEEQPPLGATPMQQPPPRGNQGQGGTQPPPPPAGHLHFPLYLSKDQKAALYVPAEMSAQEYALLKTQINNSFLVMEATAVVADPAPQPTQAEAERPKPPVPTPSGRATTGGFDDFFKEE